LGIPNLGIPRNIHPKYSYQKELNLDQNKTNLDFCKNHTKAHLHGRLIVGLPGESIEQFGKNLNLLYSMSKAEIQIGILKKLSGTTIDRHAQQSIR